MIVLLDTSTPECRLTIVDSDKTYDHTWQADRGLARGLLAYIRDTLAEHDATIADITGVGVLQGPGSFTGLRIGITVANSLAEGLGVPIVGVSGDAWRDEALTRLKAGESDQIVMPLYGAEANITKPRK